jgi:hypothetical protein
VTRNELGAQEKEADSAHTVAQEAAPSWDFSKIPVFSPGRAERFQMPPLFPAPRLPIQAKLKVGAVNDPLEHEADRVADQVMRMPTSDVSAAAAPPQVSRKCAACEEEEQSPTVHAAVVNELLQSSGKPLDSSTRAFFDPRFGRDFSQVRVHVDERAARSAQSIGALAYTVGPHIAFAAGRFAPGSDRGRRLLAHELVHTVQQGHSRIQRHPGAIQQGEVGLVDNPEEFEDKESGPTEVAGLSQEMIQRSATWKGATVHETVNLAEMPFGGPTPVTWHLLNGTKLETTADADSAIKVPGVTTTALPSTDPKATWMAKVDTVPAQEGSADETVLSPAPWSTVVTKAQVGTVTGLAACSGPGNSTFTRHGIPSDDSVYKANRRHEDRHVADHKVAFDDAIGNWDKKVQEAKDKGTEFKGASAAAATAGLWAAMGNTPKDAARSYRSKGFAKATAFHATAAGGPMTPSNPVSSPDCSTSAMDSTNPMP